MSEETEFRKACLKWLKSQGKNMEGRVLHVGSGVDSRHYSRFFPQSSDYVNLDKKKQPNVDIIADIQNMPHILSSSYDCVIAVFMLYQVLDVHAALKELNRVLKASGVLLAELTGPGWHSTGGVNRWTLVEALDFVEGCFRVKSWKMHFEDGRLVGTFVRGEKM